ncbi:MAG: PD-(D/E)XK nuclease family protein [Clostridium sp.]|nr:PD-(D/E)XK nuclease family protein [Clostridium sp.]MCI7443264.1 PD-(D/E)XK nuclease family protein [Clostridium sp.]
MIENKEEKALQDFLLDIECLDELLPWSGKFNLFDVLKISKTEIRHSNMLAWLLNPNENHGLGDAYLRGIFQRLVENDLNGRYDIFKILLLDMFSFSVYREWNNIDILLVSKNEKVLMAIENKVGSCEHSNQLNRYRNILEKEYEDYQRIYVFLTPDGEEPSDIENWDILTYNDVVEVLENICCKIELQPDVSIMIKNYIISK